MQGPDVMRRLKQTLHDLRTYRLLHWARPERLSLLALTGCNMAAAFLSVRLSLATRGIIDGAVAGSTAAVGRYVLILVSLILLLMGLRLFGSGIAETCRMRLNRNIRQEVMEALLRKRYRQISGYHSGDLTNRMLSDVRIVADGILGVLPPLANMLTRLVSASVILLQINWRFTAVLYLVGLFILFGATLLRRKMQALHRQVQEEEGRVQSAIQETIANLRLVKASGAEAHMAAQLEERQAAHLRVQIKRRMASLIANTGLSVLMEGCWLYTLVWGSARILSGSISYGTLTAMMQLVGQVQSPFSGMSSLLQRFFSTAASAERLEELLRLPDEEAPAPDMALSPSLLRDFQAIDIDDVTFSYERSQVLSRLSGRIDRGDFVAVTGLSGVGKSTLFLLLLGIYAPDSGVIRFLCKEEAPTASLQTRRLFAYVPQGNTLFSGTLRDNLTMFQPGAPDEDVMEAADIACIADFIQTLPDGLDTRIGERGLGLSEGQAQRIAVARAFLSHAPVLLLDEATSALDDRTEARLLANLQAMHNRTCLIVTHREAALKICNKQLIITEGQGDFRDI